MTEPIVKQGLFISQQTAEKGEDRGEEEREYACGSRLQSPFKGQRVHFSPERDKVSPFAPGQQSVGSRHSGVSAPSSLAAHLQKGPQGAPEVPY